VAYGRDARKCPARGCTSLPAIDGVGDTVDFWFSEHRDLPAAKRFLRKALRHHGRPNRIVIDGSQTNREAIISCDAENRLRDRSRRALKANLHSQKPILEQSHRAGSPPHQAPGATDAWLQVILLGLHHIGWHRDGSHDAQTPGSLRLQSDAHSQRTIRGNRRLKCDRRIAASCLHEYLRRNTAHSGGQLSSRPFLLDLHSRLQGSYFLSGTNDPVN